MKQINKEEMFGKPESFLKSKGIECRRAPTLNGYVRDANC